MDHGPARTTAETRRREYCKPMDNQGDADLVLGGSLDMCGHLVAFIPAICGCQRLLGTGTQRFRASHGNIDVDSTSYYYSIDWISDIANRFSIRNYRKATNPSASCTFSITECSGRTYSVLVYLGVREPLIFQCVILSSPPSSPASACDPLLCGVKVSASIERYSRNSRYSQRRVFVIRYNVCRSGVFSPFSNAFQSANEIPAFARRLPR